MKKVVLLVMVCAMCISLFGCGGIVLTQDEINSGSGSDKIYVDTPAKSFDEEAVKEKLSVATYTYDNDYWSYAFVEVTNNSEYDLEVSVDVKFYDAEGNLIGANSSSESPVQQGTSALLYFMPDEPISSMEYEVSVAEEDYYEAVVKDLSYEAVTAKEKEIVSITNNGTEAAEFVECYMLFFSGDKVVGFANNYFVDDDSELKPGKTITEEMDCYANYDSYKIYFTGRR